MPPFDLMDVATRKLRRAQKLSASFLREVSEWEDKRIGIELERDDSLKIISFKAMRVPAIPDDWTDQVSDIMQNARNALDHIAFALAFISNGYSPLDERDARKIQFPWAKSETSFKALTKSSGQYFRAEDWQRLEELQIHNAGNADIWGDDHRMPFPHGVPLFLGALFKLANVDKHRTALPLWFGIGETSGPPDEVNGCPTSGGSIMDRPIAAGEVFAEWRFSDALPEAVSFELISKHLPLRLRINEGFFHWPEALDIFTFYILDMMKILEGSLRSVGTVLWTFEPVLRRAEPPRPTLAAAREQGWL
ncbi:hypothetical protein [Micromonospora aurantiaca (nom. illeg.)]|uniref:hypothetical protein n=1 Tax=Micromonospora aurantiaca (nom. illeg.) TaxID=47850 RepID=UPI003EC0B4A4